MDVSEALDQLSEIHGHMAKGEIYRGYRPVPVALAGVIGIAAAALQARIVPEATARTFVLYWVAVAAINLAIHATSMVSAYLREDAFARRRTQRVVGQFAPCVAAGAMLTVGAMQAEASVSPLLPGAWAILFSLGIFASRPYLPRAIGWVGLFHMTAGGVLLLLSDGGSTKLGLGMGATFGVGLLLAALVLYLDLERPGAEPRPRNRP